MLRERAQMELSGADKKTVKGLVFSAVSFSFLGGVCIGTGLDQIIFKRVDFRWIGDLLTGVAFFSFGVFWAVMLLRRVRAELLK